MARYPDSLDEPMLFGIPTRLINDFHDSERERLPLWRKIFYPWLTQKERAKAFELAARFYAEEIHYCRYNPASDEVKAVMELLKDVPPSEPIDNGDGTFTHVWNVEG